MTQLFLLPSAKRSDPAVEAWFEAGHGGMRLFARPWFERMRACGEDVRELIHDGAPTACVGDAAFGYVAAFTTHLNIGFYPGADLPDPAGLLQGTGKRMRHAKVRWGEPVDEAALGALIEAAYRDVRRVAAGD
jgi:hypothetical protein